MRTIFLALAALLLAAPAAAQDGGCTLTVKTAKKAPGTPDALTIYGKATIVIAVAVAASPDAACHVTDADAFDGIAGVQVPAGEYTVMVRVTGKIDGAFQVAGETVGRGHGTPLWIDQSDNLSISDGSTWILTGEGKNHLQVRLLPVPPEPTPE